MKYQMQLLEENIRLKQINIALYDQILQLSNKIDKMKKDILEEIRNNKQVIEKHPIYNAKESTRSNDQVVTFIPSFTSNDMKINVSKVKKKHSGSDLTDSADKLSNLNGGK